MPTPTPASSRVRQGKAPITPVKHDPQAEQLLKSMLDVQKDFRNNWAAVASQQEAMLTKMFDNQASLLDLLLRQQAARANSRPVQEANVAQEANVDSNGTLEMDSARTPPVSPGDADLDKAARKPSLRASGLECSPEEESKMDANRRKSSARVSRVCPAAHRSQTMQFLGNLEKEKAADEYRNNIVDHPYFKGVIYAVILLNALAMGLQVDYTGGSWDTLWEVVDYSSTAVFVIEAIIKICVLRIAYFLDPWDLLDLLIVCSAIVDLFMSGSHLAVFQILRLGRLIKILKMKRDLVALIGSIFESLKAMFWVCVLMALSIYTGAILCVDVIRNEDGYASYGFDNKQYFGDLGSSMLTLFSISILDYWSEVVWPVSRVQPFMLPFFGFFLVITSFSLMNALIGIVVERTTVAASRAKEQDQEFMREQKLRIAYELIDVVSVMDDSKDGLITVEELENVKESDTFKKIMDQFDFPPGFSLADLHLILDDSGNGELSSEEFIDGIFKLIFCCTDFHNQCVTKLSFANLKQENFKLRRDIFSEMKTMRDEFRNALESYTKRCSPLLQVPELKQTVS